MVIIILRRKTCCGLTAPWNCVNKFILPLPRNRNRARSVSKVQTVVGYLPHTRTAQLKGKLDTSDTLPLDENITTDFTRLKVSHC